eukprot:5672469-Pyramimonas_sp.AAC.1
MPSAYSGTVSPRPCGPASALSPEPSERSTVVRVRAVGGSSLAAGRPVLGHGCLHRLLRWPRR